MKISSQKHIDQDIVNQKIENRDYTVTLATIEHDGETYQVVIDGHHSLEAARRTKNNPIFIEADYNYQSEADFMGFDDWLAQHWMDSDWYDINTGKNVW